MAGDDQHRHLVAALAQGAQRLGAVHLGHPEVEKNGLRRALADLLQRFEPVPGLLDAIALELEHHPQALADRGLVIHHENRGFRSCAHDFSVTNENGAGSVIEPARRGDVDCLLVRSGPPAGSVQGTRTIAK